MEQLNTLISAWLASPSLYARLVIASPMVLATVGIVVGVLSLRRKD